jgi:hypothetical protein
MSRRKQDSSNRAVVALPVFVPDPAGHRLFADITNMSAPVIRSAPIVEHGSGMWSGWTKDPQRFRGLAALTRSRAVVERGSGQLADARSDSTTNPALAVFAQRAARGQS